MNTLIALSEEEVSANFDFVFTLVEKGHTIKITTTSGQCVLMTPIAKNPIAAQLNMPESIDDFAPDPAATAAFVTESLQQMSHDF